MTFRRTVYLIKKDLLRRIYYEGNKPSGLRMLATMLSPPGMAVTICRLQSYFFAANLYPVSKILAVLNIILYGVEIPPTAQIDEGLVFGHANGILLNPLVRIGKNCLLMHQNGISPNCTTGFVVIGDNVMLDAGAKIIGILTIGDNCVIGMNAVVTKSLPPFSAAQGMPARSSAVQKTPDTLIPPDTGRRRNPVTFGQTLHLIKKDLLRRIYCDGNQPSQLRIFSVLLSPPGMAVTLFRLQSYCFAKKLAPLERLLSFINIVFYSVAIDSGVQIAEGMAIGHTTGIVIGGNVTIGKNCSFVHHNSIITRQPHERIILEDEIVVGAGARITGSVTIGRGSIIGMNAVVEQSLPPCSVAAGVPARVIKTLPSVWAETTAPETAQKPAEPPRFPISLRETLRLMRTDLYYRTTVTDNKRFTPFVYVKLFLNPPALAVVLYRLGHWAWQHDFRLLTKLLSVVNIMAFSVDIAPQVQIGEGFILAHANGMVVTGNVRIGKNCVLTFHNTLSIGPREHMDPANDWLVLEDGVVVGGGARVVGNTTVGHHSIIGMNAVVTRSAPPFSLLAGVPAAVIGRADQQKTQQEAARSI